MRYELLVLGLMLLLIVGTVTDVWLVLSSCYMLLTVLLLLMLVADAVDADAVKKETNKQRKKERKKQRNKETKKEREKRENTRTKKRKTQRKKERK